MVVIRIPIRMIMVETLQRLRKSDGPALLGDFVAVTGATLFTIVAIGFGVHVATQAPAISDSKEEKKAVAVPKTKRTGTTYYHATTTNNATAIALTGIMIGSKWEGGYVHAWRSRPSNYAVKNSGAKANVLISFKTNASFSIDTGIDNPKVLSYGPIVSTRLCPIAVWDVKIIGVIK